MSHGADSIKSIVYALGANLAIAIAKLAAAIYTSSGSMLAESVHSLADCGNQTLLLWGLKESKKPPTPEFPLGFGKAIYFWSFIVALMLFSMGGIFSVYEGFHKLQYPETLHEPWIAIAILGFSIIMESVSLWGALREINKARGKNSIWRWFRTTRQSELQVVLGEDVAALAGLVLALIFLLLAIIFGDSVWDAFGSIAIGVLLIAVACAIGIEVHGLLIGQSIHPEEHAAIEAFLKTRPEIDSLQELTTLQLGPDMLIAIKAKIHNDWALATALTAMSKTETEIKLRFPAARWVFFEPYPD